MSYYHRDVHDFREQMAASGDPEVARLMEAGPLSVSDTLQPVLCDPDPLPYGTSVNLSLYDHFNFYLKQFQHLKRYE